MFTTCYKKPMRKTIAKLTNQTLLDTTTKTETSESVMFFYEENEYLSFSEEDTRQEENKVSLG